PTLRARLRLAPRCLPPEPDCAGGARARTRAYSVRLPSMATTAAEWIASLDLAPHPEGGFYRETYRSSEIIDAAHLPVRFGGPRAHSTAIYFLLPGDQVSALHRIKSDEIWHFYAGGTLTLTLIHPDGRLEQRRLGSDEFQ